MIIPIGAIYSILLILVFIAIVIIVCITTITSQRDEIRKLSTELDDEKLSKEKLRSDYWKLESEVFLKDDYITAKDSLFDYFSESDLAKALSHTDTNSAVTNKDRIIYLQLLNYLLYRYNVKYKPYQLEKMINKKYLRENTRFLRKMFIINTSTEWREDDFERIISSLITLVTYQNRLRKKVED